MWRTVIALLVATTIAYADTDGDAALAKIDSAMGAVVFVSSTWDIKSSQSKHNAKHQAMTIMAKGDKVYAELDDVPSAGLLTRFLSSATDTSGMRFMQPGINDGEPRSADRRMLLDNGATLKEVAFSPDDWSLVAFATSYVATLAPANTGEVALVLVPRPAAQQSGIEKIELVAKADTNLPITVKWYARGKLVRSDNRANYKCDATRCMAWTREIVTPTLSSKFVAKTIDLELPDDHFTPAYLAR